MEWTTDQIDFLILNYEIYGPTFVGEKLNRNPKSVGNKARKIGLKFDSSKFYKSNEFDYIVSISNNLVNICQKIGLKLTGGNRNTIKKWIKVKKLDTSHFFIDRSKINKNSGNIFKVDSNSDRRIIKNVLFRDGIKERKCELCGQNESWIGKKMTLILDHINGVNDDNRLENLRILCPNCNSTLDTNGGKNIKNKLKQVY